MSTKMHNHDHCIAEAVETVENICVARQTRFTPLRRRVLELVWHGHKPVTAYELLDRLSEKEQKKIAPPTVYRALDFLVEEGFVHRLESLNAFIGCPDPAFKHQGQFLICHQCRTVVELNDNKLTNQISRTAQAHDYTYDYSMLEIMGLCLNCRAA